MTALALTRHAETRMRQRGLRNADLSLVLEVASPIGPDVYLLTDEDIAQEVCRLKHRLQRVERLRGIKVVVAEGEIVTTYRSTPMTSVALCGAGGHRDDCNE